MLTQLPTFPPNLECLSSHFHRAFAVSILSCALKDSIEGTVHTDCIEGLILVLIIAFALVLAIGLGLGLRLVQALAHVHATSQVLMGREQWGAICLSFSDFGVLWRLFVGNGWFERQF